MLLRSPGPLLAILALLGGTACQKGPLPGRAELRGKALVNPADSPEGMTVRLVPGTLAGVKSPGMVLDLSNPEARAPLLAPELASQLSAPEGAVQFTDSGGRFAFKDLPPGTYHLEFKSQGQPVGSLYPEVWVVVVGIELRADQVKDFKALVVVPPKKSYPGHDGHEEY